MLFIRSIPMLFPWLDRWLKRQTQASRRGSRRYAPVLRGRCKPWVELLEDRILLSSVSWNTDADGQWNVAANWLDDQHVARVPTAADDVTIDRGAANPTITI